MMRHLPPVLVLAMLSVGLVAQAPAADVLLKQALQREQVDSDLSGAIDLYRQIIETHAGDDAAVSQALVQLAGIYDRQGRTDEARTTYARLLERYPTSLAAASSRSRLSPAPGAVTVLSRRRLADAPLNVQAAFGRVSPDGQWMSFNDQGIGQSSGNLGVWRIGTRETRLVTSAPCCEWADGFALTSAWSRDGRRLAYAWQQPGAGGVDLRIVSRDGGPSEVLFAGTRAAFSRTTAAVDGDVTWIEPLDWSPDGRSILAWFGEFVGPGTVGRRRLVRVSILDRTVTTLAALGSDRLPLHAAYSPNGAFIAYDAPASDGRSDRDIFVVAADGTSPQPLVSDPASTDRLIGWTPDGAHVVYTADRLGTIDAWALPVRAGRPLGDPVLLQANVGSFEHQGMTAEGRFFAQHVINRADVYVATVDPASGRFTAAPRPLPRAQPGPRGQGTWSPDGTRLAYFQRSTADVYTLSVQDIGTNAVRVYPLPVRNMERPVWRPDGRAIAFNAVGDSDPQALFLLDLETGRVDRVTPGEQVAFSPDGQHLYYPRRVAPTGVQSELVRRRMTDGLEEVVHRGAGLYIALVSSPDGSRFAGFVPNSGGRGLSVVVFPSQGGTPHTVVEQLPALDNEVAWSPDGAYLYLSTHPLTPERLDAAIWRVPVTGGVPEKVGAAPWPAWVKHLSVAPDGRLAISVVGSDVELWSWDNLPELVRLRAGR